MFFQFLKHLNGMHLLSVCVQACATASTQRSENHLRESVLPYLKGPGESCSGHQAWGQMPILHEHLAGPNTVNFSLFFTFLPIVSF